MSYPAKKLGGVLKSLESGSRPKGGVRQIFSGIPSIGAEHLSSNGGFAFEKIKYIPVDFFNNLRRGIIHFGDVLVVKDGATTGKVSLVTKGFPFAKAAVNEHVFILRPDDKNILSEFLFYFLFSNAGQVQILRTFHGMAQGGISSDFVNQVEIPLPPLSEQKKIITKLEKILAKISEVKKLRAEALENTDNLLSAELHKIFEEGKKKGWEERELGEVFTLNYGKGLARSERSEDGKYIVYGANGELGRSDKHLIEGDGIIIGRKGSAGEITRVLGKYWPTDVTYFVTEDKNYDINFVYYLFKFLNFPQYAVGVKPGINRNQIYKIKISFPSLAEQKKIVAWLDKLSQKIEKIKKLQTATQNEFTILEQSILSKAFKGELWKT